MGPIMQETHSTVKLVCTLILLSLVILTIFYSQLSWCRRHIPFAQASVSISERCCDGNRVRLSSMAGVYVPSKLFLRLWGANFGIIGSVDCRRQHSPSWPWITSCQRGDKNQPGLQKLCSSQCLDPLNIPSVHCSRNSISVSVLVPSCSRALTYVYEDNGWSSGATHDRLSN